MLSETLKAKLYCAHNDVIMLEPGSCITGTHWNLIAVLNECGYNPKDKCDAVELAEKILCGEL